MRGIGEVDRDTGPLDAGVLTARWVHIGGERHRLEALPVRERTQRRVGRQQVVEVGGAGPRQAGDDDRSVDRDVTDLGVPVELVGDQQPVAHQLGEEGVDRDVAHGRQRDVVPEAVEGSAHRVPEAVPAEVGEAHLGRGLLADGVDLEHQRVGERRGRFHHLSHVGREDGVGQVVDPHDVGLAHVRPVLPGTSWIGTTSHDSGSGVVPGRNQRIQMRPERCPWVLTQFGCPGSSSATTTTHDPSAS
jgi:hypothetical protein